MSNGKAEGRTRCHCGRKIRGTNHYAGGHHCAHADGTVGGPYVKSKSKKR